MQNENAGALIQKERKTGNFLVVQWLEFHDFTAKGTGSIPGWRTKIPQAL